MVDHTIGPYRILQRLGAGGMGEVFLAEDPRLGRRVAIKRATIARSGGDALAQLRREAFAAAQLNHPNVAAIYDVVDADGVPHIVMEYVEGETLAEVVRRGPLTTEQVIVIARQIADALTEAHGNGIIHRDLKPANVMVAGGSRVKVLDFGIARERPAETDDKPTSLETQVYGTPAYMAPEQLTGARGDARSDIYSFGALLFELLAGEPPFKGDALARIGAATKRPPQPRDVNPAVPPPLNDVVVRAMAFRPEHRFASVGTMKHALDRAAGAISEAPTTAIGVTAARRLPSGRWWKIAAVCVVAVLGIFGAWRLIAPERRAPGSPVVVAVLPFQVAQGEKELEGLATGLTEIIVNGLASSPSLTAVPRSESSGYAADKRPAAEARRIAKDLGADRLIDGDLRRNEAGVDLTIRMGRVDRSEGWQERSYSSPLDDVLTLGRRILRDITVQLDADASQVQQASTSLEAFQQYAQARGLLDRRDIPGNVDRAIELLEAAAARDARFSLAQAALGEACYEKYRQTRERSWVDRGEQAILLALSIDGNQPLVRYSLATILHATGHSDRAEQELRTIVRTHPVDSAHRRLGIILIERGRVDDAMHEFQRAIDVRPGFWGNYATLGVAALKAGRHPEAERAFLRVTELQPDNADAYANLATVYLLTNQRERAIELFRRSIRAAPTVSAWSNLGSALTEAGRHEEALDAFRQAGALRPRDPLVHRNIGDSLAHLARSREARSAYLEGVRLAREALSVNPKSAETHGALAICLAKSGQFDEALKHVAAAAAIAPNAPEPYHRRAAVLALAGRPAEAIMALTEARRRGLSAAIAARDDDLADLRSLPGFQQLVRPTP